MSHPRIVDIQRCSPAEGNYPTVAYRAVSRSEMLCNPDAVASMKEEWNGKVCRIKMSSTYLGAKNMALSLSSTELRTKRCSWVVYIGSVLRRTISSQKMTRGGSSREEACCAATKSRTRTLGPGFGQLAGDVLVISVG